MHTVNYKHIGTVLQKLLNDQNAIDEDIGIIDDEQNVLGVVISKEAYEFF